MVVDQASVRQVLDRTRVVRVRMVHHNHRLRTMVSPAVAAVPMATDGPRVLNIAVPRLARHIKVRHTLGRHPKVLRAAVSNPEGHAVPKVNRRMAHVPMDHRVAVPVQALVPKMVRHRAMVNHLMEDQTDHQIVVLMETIAAGRRIMGLIAMPIVATTDRHGQLWKATRLRMWWTLLSKSTAMTV